VVRVPVLSKAQTLIFPPYGILNGSVQNILFFYKYNREVLTDIERIIGNSGGTT